MKWAAIKIKTLTEAEDIIISALYDIGLEGAQIEDKIPLSPLEKEQMFVDILPQTEEDDGIAYLSFFVEKNTNKELKLNDMFISLEELKQKVINELNELRTFMDIGDGTIEIGETEDIDWVNNWKQYFHQFYVDDLLIIPSWEEISKEDGDKMIMRIDPGTAFGTGMHETTQLCIRQLKKYIKNKSKILDIGTGSGILGILSLMMGGETVVGTDLDPCTAEAVQDNLKMNKINKSGFTLIIGNIITDSTVQEQIGDEEYDIATANILAEVLIPLAPVVLSYIKPGGIFITSGIIEEKEIIVEKALIKAGFEIMEINQQGEWVSITAKK